MRATLMTWRALPLLALLLAAPAGAQEANGPDIVAPDMIVDEAALGRTVERTLAAYAAPTFERFRELADTLRDEAAALCREPSAARLAATRDAFRGAVLAWGRVGFLKLPPLVEANRAERIHFWPDPRGIGERQMRALLGRSDPSATDPAALKGKSVAVQGLPAIERLLYAAPADALASAAPASHPCRYLATASAGVAETAAELEAAFLPDAPFVRQMLSPGPGNALYATPKEAAEDILNLAAAAIGEVRDGVIEVALGETPAAAKPKTAPFWRSGLALPFLRERVSGVAHLVEIAGFDEPLPETKRWILGSLILEFETSDRALAAVRLPLVEAVADAEERQALRRAVIALRGLRTLLAESLPEGLGIAIGFNASDGD